jgi:hypothetical protein
MTEENDERPAAEKGSQQIHPDKPPREGTTPQDEPNESSPGRPQHEPHDPDEDDW